MKKRSSTQELISVEAGGGGVRPCSARVQQERPHGRLLSRLSLWRFLLTGTSVTLAAEAVASLEYVDPSVQLLALTKYASTLVVQILFSGGSREASTPKLHMFGQVSLLGLGLLDVVGYACFAAGLPLCGAALSSVVSSATTQLLTAVLSFTVLGRRLPRAQLASLALVILGLLCRLASPAAGPADSQSPAAASTGIVLTVASAMAFSVMNILHEHILRKGESAPTQAEVATAVACTGLVCNLAHFAVACLPRWRILLVASAAASGITFPQAALAVLLFAVLYNCHNWAQGAVLRSEGALAVGLVNVMRGSTVTLAASAIYCTSFAWWTCFSAPSLVGTALIMAGGVAWMACSTPPEPLSKSAQRLVRAASVKLLRSLSLSARGDSSQVPVAECNSTPCS